jgi:adenylate cyclase
MLRLQIYGRFRAADDLGKEIPIKSKKARALLAFLALPPGKPRSREQLMALLWSERGDEQARGSLRQVLRGLRRDLGNDLASALRIADDAVLLDPDHVIVESISSEGQLLDGLHINDPAFEEWLRDERLRLVDETPVEHDPKPSTPEPQERPSIAVLPFVNLSGDPEQEYFADGITEDIITALARFNSLFVIARNSSFHYKGRSPKVQDVGRNLGVEYVVEGSVRRGGNRVRITAQLVEAGTGNHLWAERYDRNLDDIFAVQDEVVSNIAMMVPGQVEVANWGNGERKPTNNISAYDLFLKASQIFYKEYGALEAARLLERAIEIDPAYAEAHALLASHHAYSIFAHGVAYEEAAPAARKHAIAASKLAAKNALVHAALSETYLMIGDLDLAAHHVEKALALNPNNFIVMSFAALVKASLGEHDLGIELVEKAMRNDPYSAESFRENKLEIYYIAGRFQDALDQFVGWHDPPLHQLLVKAAILAQLGRTAEGEAEIQRFESRRPPHYNIGNIVRAYCRGCLQPEDSERWLEGFRKAGLEV